MLPGNPGRRVRADAGGLAYSVWPDSRANQSWEDIFKIISHLSGLTFRGEMWRGKALWKDKFQQNCEGLENKGKTARSSSWGHVRVQCIIASDRQILQGAKPWQFFSPVFLKPLPWQPLSELQSHYITGHHVPLHEANWVRWMVQVESKGLHLRWGLLKSSGPPGQDPQVWGKTHLPLVSAPLINKFSILTMLFRGMMS